MLPSSVWVHIVALSRPRAYPAIASLNRAAYNAVRRHVARLPRERVERIPRFHRCTRGGFCVARPAPIWERVLCCACETPLCSRHPASPSLCGDCAAPAEPLLRVLRAELDELGLEADGMGVNRRGCAVARCAVSRYRGEPPEYSRVEDGLLVRSHYDAVEGCNFIRVSREPGAG